MINRHDRMLPTSAGVEPATSWSPVGQRIQLSHRGRQKHGSYVGNVVALNLRFSPSLSCFTLLIYFFSKANTIYYENIQFCFFFSIRNSIKGIYTLSGEVNLLRLLLSLGFSFLFLFGVSKGKFYRIYLTSTQLITKTRIFKCIEISPPKLKKFR